MIFTLEVNIAGLERKFDIVVERASDIEGPLRKFGNHLKRRAIERYKAQNFAPLADSTLGHRAQKGMRTLERKLSRDVRKAFQRQQGEQAPKGLLQRALAAIGAEPGGAILAGSSRGVMNRLAVLSEFQRRHRKGSSVLMAYGGKPLGVKSLASLDKREERAVMKAVGKKILGTLPATLEVEVGFGVVTVASRTDKKWTDTHNTGGDAGHGAKIPKRETLPPPDESDMQVLEELLKEHLLEPLQ